VVCVDCSAWWARRRRVRPGDWRNAGTIGGTSRNEASYVTLRQKRLATKVSRGGRATLARNGESTEAPAIVKASNGRRPLRCHLRNDWHLRRLNPRICRRSDPSIVRTRRPTLRRRRAPPILQRVPPVPQSSFTPTGLALETRVQAVGATSFVTRHRAKNWKVPEVTHKRPTTAWNSVR